MLRPLFLTIAVAVAPTVAASAQSGAHHHRHHDSTSSVRRDSAFAAMQARGKDVMGVDQYSSVHVFDALPDGGRIELQRPDADSAEVEVIRAHLRDIARRFGDGDFGLPGMVHDGEVPGTRTLAERRDHLHYEFRSLPKGGEVLITSHDEQALAALREFMAFQQREHHAEGRPR